MRISPTDHKAVLAAFLAYLQHKSLAFAGFEPTHNPAEALTGYLRGLPRRPDAAELTALGQARDQSLAVLWRTVSERNASPVVAWMSSDGIPNGVLATSLANFLTLLPYGVGLSIAVLEAQLDHREDPSRFPDARTKIGPDRVHYFWQKGNADEQTEAAGRADYLTWLRETFGLQVAPDPVALIVGALENSPDFDQWLASFE